jgi:hypothetical protein
MSRLVIPASTLKSASVQAVAALAPSIERGIEDVVDEIKKQMINEFMDHPVTEEILNGYNASNSSGTLGGYGNLFSFIGFEENDSPILPILDILGRVEVRVSKNTSSPIVVATIFMPTAKDIFQITPMPWASGRSWARGIESGISGLGHYINAYGSGRSGSGIQTENKMRSGRFNATPYISSLINKYQKIMSQINGARINIKPL